MKVSFRQEGGYTGLPMACDLDTANMPQEEVAQLHRLLEQADLAKIKENLLAQGTGPPDGFTYELTVESPSGSVNLTFDDATKPQGITELLNFLRRRAKIQPVTG